MKKILFVFALAAVFAACNNGTSKDNNAQHNAIKLMKDSLKLDSFKRADVQKKQQQKIDSLSKIAAVAQANADRGNRGGARGHYASDAAPGGYTSGASQSSNAVAQPQASKKKGWSEAAKGAAIGGGAGIITGMLIDKKDVRGGLIGGAVGAGAGYLIGRAKDRKSGRVQPKHNN